MPLAAYFRNVGAFLLALLLIADFYLPTPPVARNAEVYRPAIRIHSQPKVPAPVAFDTTQIALAAAPPASWDINPPVPPIAREMPLDDADGSGLRAAYAMFPRADSHRAAQAEQRKRQPVRKYAAKGMRRYATHQIVLAARPGQFGWFGSRYW